MKHRSRARFVLEGIEGLFLVVIVFFTWPVSRLWLSNCGSLASERDADWAGDSLVSEDHQTYTRATTIAAPADRVWPWLAQFGLDKAGFYSYELLERLVGIPVTNVESMEADMQALAVGDTVRLHPRAPGIPVGLLTPGTHICFGGQPPTSSKGDTPDPNRSWSMYLKPIEEEACRFVLRSCIEVLRNRSWPRRLSLALEVPIDFVMEQRMLRTVRRLAETNWRRET